MLLLTLLSSWAIFTAGGSILMIWVGFAHGRAKPPVPLRQQLYYFAAAIVLFAVAALNLFWAARP